MGAKKNMKRLAAAEKAGTTPPTDIVAGKGPTTLSTRFDEIELSLLSEVARAKQWSLAQLIRVGAIQKAIHVKNLSGASRPAVDQFAANLLEHLLTPEVFYLHDGQDISVEEAETEMQEHMPGLEARARRFADWQLENLIRIIRTIGADFATVLEDELRRRTATATSSLSSLLDPTTIDFASTSISERLFGKQQSDEATK